MCCWVMVVEVEEVEEEKEEGVCTFSAQEKEKGCFSKLCTSFNAIMRGGPAPSLK